MNSETACKIEIRDLTMAYGSFVVMRDVNVKIKRGEICIIMGGSGCGKSTLLRQMIGLKQPALGDVYYDGVAFWKSDEEARTEKQSNSAREDRSPNILKKFRDGFSREHHFRVGEAPMYFNEGMRRLAVFAGVLGAVAGGFYAHKNLRNVPSERYQHRVFEKLAASDVVKRDQSILRLAKENGAILNEPISSELLHPRSAINLPKGLTLITPPATLPPDFKDWDSTKPASTNGIKAIFYKPDLTIDYFEMQDGGYVSSEPSPSAWSYLLWVVFPALGFFILWSAIRGIAWVGTGFFQPPN